MNNDEGRGNGVYPNPLGRGHASGEGALGDLIRGQKVEDKRMKVKARYYHKLWVHLMG